MKVGVIGAGNMGKNHVRIYSELEESQLIAVADPSEEGKMVAEKHSCKHYSDYKDMLDKENLDAVSICVPTSMHHKVALDVIRKGVNLLVEKPIAGTSKEGREIVEAAKSKGVLLTVGHIERFNPAVQKLKELIDEGKLGHITSIIARRVGLFPPQIKDANVVIDLAVHDIDIFSYLLGKDPEKVISSGGKALIENRDDYSDIFLKYKGTNGFIEVNWITPVKIRMLNVTGTKGYAELDYITQKLFLFKSNYEKEYDKFGDFVVKFGEPEKIEVDVKKEEPLKLELKSFLEAIKEGKEPLVTGDEAVKALEIAETAME